MQPTVIIYFRTLPLTFAIKEGPGDTLTLREGEAVLSEQGAAPVTGVNSLETAVAHLRQRLGEAT